MQIILLIIQKYKYVKNYFPTFTFRYFYFTVIKCVTLTMCVNQIKSISHIKIQISESAI